jgi:hypothetical protein
MSHDRRLDGLSGDSIFLRGRTTKEREEDEEDEIPMYTLELTDIREDTTPGDLRRLFSKYGDVFRVCIDSDYRADFYGDLGGEHEDSEPTKVTAHVTMRDYQATSARSKLNGRHWRGRALNIGGHI